MGLSFDILIFDYLLKAPQPVTGLFFDTSGRIKVHLLVMYCIKNLSIGLSYGALLNLIWIFKYVTSGPFSWPLSADFPDVKKLAGFCCIRYFEFLAQSWQKGVKICCPE